MHKKLASIICVFLLCSLQADSQLIPHALDSFYPPIERDKHFWIATNLLCLHPKEKGLVLTNEATNLTSTALITSNPCINPHFKWSVGYRIGVGYLLPSHKWDITLNWSHLKSHTNQWRNIQEKVGFGMFPIWALADDITPFDWVSEANMCWHLNLNLLDFDFGRIFSCKNQLFLRLLIGLRLARINQLLNVNYGGGIFANGPNLPAMDSRSGYDTLFMKNNFWGIGPRIGIEPHLNLGKGCRFYSSAYATLSGSLFDIIQNECYLKNTRYDKNCSFKCVRGMLDATAGLMWETLCHNDRYALALALGWEYHLFFKQLELATKFGLANHNRNLSLNGLALFVHLDF